MWTWLRENLRTGNDFGPDPEEAPTARAPEQPADRDKAREVLETAPIARAPEPPADAAPAGSSEPSAAVAAEELQEAETQPEVAAPLPGDTRRAVVNTLEYTYGALLPLLVFLALLNFSDPAQEVLAGFLADAKPETAAPTEQWSAENIQDRIHGTVTYDDLTASFGSLLDPLFQAAVALFMLPVLAHALGWWVAHLTMGGVARQGSANTAYDLAVAGCLLSCIPLVAFAGIGAAMYQALVSEEARAMGVRWLPWPIYAVLAALGLYALSFFPFPFISSLTRYVLASVLKAIVRNTPQRPVIWALTIAVIVTVILGAGLVFALNVGFDDPHSHDRVGPVALMAIFFILLTVFLTALTLLSLHMPGNFPLILLLPLLAMAASTQAGTFVALALVALLLCLTLMKYRLRAFGQFGAYVYAGTLLLLGGYVFLHQHTERCGSLAGCNLIEGLPRPPAALSSIAETLPHLADGTGPLRIVAAQGGGLYAAYHTAYYLAARADRDPAFAPSLYAISGVSGGAVGAGVFWAIETSGYCDAVRPEDMKQTTCRRDAVDVILKRDFLTPALAMLLFHDALDTFVPVTSVRHFLDQPPYDRGRALEREVELAVADWLETAAPSPAQHQAVIAALARQGLAPDAPLSMAISASAWGLLGRQDDAPHVAPLLFLNGTRVHDGAKVVAAPVQRIGAGARSLSLEGGRDLSVINAMIMSARFPGVSPPARVLSTLPDIDPDPASTHVVQLADGGYFDNSGLETAVDIVEAVRVAQRTQESPQRPIEILALVNEEEPGAPVLSGTVGAPVATFLGAWHARGLQTKRRVGERFATAPEVTICEATTDPRPLNFTVSWYLSDASLAAIAQDVEADIRQASARQETGAAC